MNKSSVFRWIVGLLLMAMCLSACGANTDSNQSVQTIPEIPKRLKTNEDKVPILKVYDTGSKKSEKMDIESYIMGVVAGEMKNSWPIEALKAQAILARTFTMKFVSDKKSSYDDADISTDVNEAQAYDADAVNDRVREAVNETRGQVMAVNGEFPYAWFHAHSGGMTELPTKALEYESNPAYLHPVKSQEAEDAPEDVKRWTAEFSKDKVTQACADTGVEVGEIERFEIGERGESGRAVSFLINGKEVSAPSFRLQIGASELKSTMIHEIEVLRDRVRFSGSGFGHGVGMSQWGAYQMAKDGKNAEDIVQHYFSNVDVVKLW